MGKNKVKKKKDVDKRSSVHVLWQQTNRHGLMVIQILCNVYLVGVAIYISQLAKRSIDENLIVTDCVRVVGLFAFLGIVGILVSFLHSYVSGRYAAYMTAQIREKSLERIAHCHYSYIEKEHSGIIINKLTNDVETVSEYIAFNLPEVIRSGITFICSFIYLLTVNYAMTLACTICIPVALWMTKKFANPTYNTMEQFWKQMDEISAMAKDTLSESKVEKSYNLQDVRGQVFDSKMNGATKIYVDYVRLMAKSGAFKYILRSAPTLLCILVGFVAAYMGVVTGGTFAAFILMLRNISEPLSKSVGYVTDYKEVQVSMDRVVEILRLEDEDAGKNVDNPQEVQKLCGNVKSTENEQLIETMSSATFEFKKVSFSYGNSQVLQKLSGVIQKGKMTAIVGESGSGKSTLFKILAGFYDIQSGEILMNGDKLSAISKNEVREQIAYVEQNSFLFNKTVSENIAAGKLGATMQEIVRAAKSAYAHEFIMNLPNGYQTILSEEGLNISGGQRQRIAIARAFVKDASVLLMDEMTSALDLESEKLIQKALDEYRKNRTVIVVAHRLSTIVHADEILVLKDGAFVEKGTHKDLLKQNGHYAHLYEKREKI